jgi:chromosome segregation ATPase
VRAENARLGRAVGELSTENAELYKRVGELEADLKTEKLRHSAWSREITRDREQTTAIIADFKEELAELRQQLGEKSTPSEGSTPDRLEGHTLPSRPRR